MKSLSFGSGMKLVMLVINERLLSVIADGSDLRLLLMELFELR